MAEKTDLHKQALKAFAEAQEAEKHNRDTAIDAIRFARLGEQWPEEIIKARKEEMRPCLTINKMPSIANQTINDARQNKPALEIHASDDDADPETAQVYGGLIRNIEYQSGADIVYDTATENAVYGGVGYIRVATEYAYDDVFHMDIRIKRVANAFSIYGDPNSTEADSSDWDVAFVVDQLTKEQFEAQWGDKAKTSFNDDSWTEWRDKDAETVTVAEWWTREETEKQIWQLSDGSVVDEDGLNDEDIQLQLSVGALQITGQRTTKAKKVMQRFVSGAEILEEKEWPGCYIPIVPVYGEEFNVQGKRYFRPMLIHAFDAQRNYNFHRSAATEKIALAPKVPFVGPMGFADRNIEKWNTANTKNWPYLEYDPQAGPPPQRQPLDMGRSAGELQEALSAAEDIKQTTGIFDASLGARSNETSGRAILARQREGDVSTFHFIDNMARAIRHLGRILIDLIPKVYTNERAIRVLGEDGEQQNIRIGQAAQPQIDPATGQPIMRPDGRPKLLVHSLGTGKYDLTVKTGPSYTSQREAAAELYTETLRAYPQGAPIIAPELFKTLDMPGAKKIADKMEALEHQQVPEQVQKQMEALQTELQRLAEENAKLKQDKSDKMLEIESKHMLGEQELDQKGAIEVMKIESNERTNFYKAQANAAAQASRPVVQKPASQGR